MRFVILHGVLALSVSCRMPDCLHTFSEDDSCLKIKNSDYGNFLNSEKMFRFLKSLPSLDVMQTIIKDIQLQYM